MKKLLLFVIFLVTAEVLSQNSTADDSDYHWINKANAFVEAENYDSAYYYSKRAFEKFQLKKNDSLIIKSAILTANSVYKIHSNDSLNYIDTAKSIATKNNDWKSLIDIYFTSGNIQFEKAEHNKALVLYLKVDSISQSHNFVNSSTVKTLIKRAEISRTTFTKESSKRTYDLLHEALIQAKTLNSEELIHYTYVFLCDASGLEGKLEEAKKYIDLGLEYFIRTDQPKYAARLSLISSSYYKSIKDYEKQEEAFLNNIAYSRRIKDKKRLPEALTYYGNFQDDCNDAIKTYKEAFEIYIDLKPEIRETDMYERLLRGLAICNLELKNYKEASNYYDQAYSLKRKLVRQANRKLSRDAETKYETAKKEQEISLLKSQNELTEQQKTNQRNLLLSGLLLTSLAGIFFYFLYRNRQKTTKKLKELDSFKSKLFANISHEFRTPLTLISGPIEKRLENEGLSTNDRSDFLMIQRNSKRLLNLVNQLLDLSKLEAGHVKLQVKQGNISLLLKTIASSFEYLATQKSIDYNVDITPIENAWFDKDVIEKTVINLLTNAFKYTVEGGKIEFRAIEHNKRLQLTFENDGNNITPQQIENLFNRFYQADEKSEGVGIGLSLVKELVTISQGSIRAESKTQGTIMFKVDLPMAKTEFPKETILASEHEIDHKLKHNDLSGIEDTFETEIDQSIDLPILLIVEDNADVRQFVRESFTGEYQINEASNGEEGIKKALDLIPDIIISDIMMPKTDGLELCNTLKLDERTCHIPIILLTAKVEDQDKYKGLETGADAYISKPFKLKLLKQQLTNLINTRKILRDRYSQELILKPKDIAIVNLDEQFLEKVQTVLDHKLTEAAFSIEDFSQAVGMSRMQLHRKIKALTGLSASEFIRSQRLKLAAGLLQKSDINISEIGYQVGFNDPSYFAKCFKEAYGCTPSEYSNK